MVAYRICTSTSLCADLDDLILARPGGVGLNGEQGLLVDGLARLILWRASHDYTSLPLQLLARHTTHYHTDHRSSAPYTIVAYHTLWNLGEEEGSI